MMPGTYTRALALIATLIAATSSAQAAEIHALITTAMKAAIDELVPKFERETGNTVGVSYGPSGGIDRRTLLSVLATLPALSTPLLASAVRAQSA